VAFRKGARGGERAELDLAQLLQRYCRQFIQTDPERAFQYYLLLTLVPTDAAAVRRRARRVRLGRGCDGSLLGDHFLPPAWRRRRRRRARSRASWCWTAGSLRPSWAPSSPTGGCGYASASGGTRLKKGSEEHAVTDATERPLSPTVDEPRQPGQLQRFAPLLHLSDVDAFRDAIVADAAAAAQAAGRAEDALLLYNLAQVRRAPQVVRTTSLRAWVSQGAGVSLMPRAASGTQDYDSVLRVVTARISDCLFQTSDAERADLKRCVGRPRRGARAVQHPR